MSIADRLIDKVPILFLLVGLALLGFGLFGIGDTWWKVSEARGWPTTEGVILSRDSRDVRWVGRSSSGTRYVPEIRYRYSVGGTSFVSENVYPGTSEQWDTREELQAYMDAEFPARGPVTVSYDPDSPARSAIILRGRYWTAATLTICGLIGLVGFWATRLALKETAGGRR